MKQAIGITIAVILIGGIILLRFDVFTQHPEPVLQRSEPVAEAKSPLFRTITLTTKPGAILAKTIGYANVATVLAINRVDDKNLREGMTLVIPTSFKNPLMWQFMPQHIESANNIPKLIVVSQRTQAFGLYEYGTLVRSGPVSTGKQSTPTKSDLYFTNWKGKEVKSTFDDEWVLKWNFNIDNKEGISLHQYSLPGVPASHSCVRFYAADAEWIYNWADQWIVSADERTKLANGTPVIIYGSYNFKRKAPWKELPTNPAATTITSAEIENAVSVYVPKIEQEQAVREAVLIQ
jgi:lipoprotein-anchoring transpeptidase ErfK/SrfK